MRKRLPLLLLFVALAGIAYWLWRGDRPTTLSANMADFAVSDTARVDRIFIALKDGKTVDLQRKGNEWTANGFHARQSSVELLLRTFKGAEVRSPIPGSMVPRVLKDMAVTARKVEIYQGGKKPVKIWWVGSGTADHNGTYMLLEDPTTGKSPKPFVVGMYGFKGLLDSRFHGDMDSWRSQRFTHYPDLSTITRVAVEHPSNPAADLALDLGPNGMRLTDGQGTAVPMDTAAVRALLRTVQSGNFEEIVRRLPAHERDSVLASTPLHVLTITSSSGTQRVPFWSRQPREGELDMGGLPVLSDPNRLYGLLDDSLMVTAQRVVLGPMLTRLEYLRYRGAH